MVFASLLELRKFVKSDIEASSVSYSTAWQFKEFDVFYSCIYVIVKLYKTINVT